MRKLFLGGSRSSLLTRAGSTLNSGTPGASLPGLMQMRTAAGSSSMNVTTADRTQFVAKFGAGPCVVPLPELVSLLMEGKGASADDDAAKAATFDEIVSNDEAFAVSGNYVSLAPSKYCKLHWEVQKALSSLPDEGAMMNSLPPAAAAIFEGKDADWFAMWNDVVEYDATAGTLIPVNQHANKFVRALRRVIYSAPAEGLTVSELIGKLTEILGEDDTDPERHGFSQLGEALLLACDIHFVATPSSAGEVGKEEEAELEPRIVPVDWSYVMYRIFQSLPAEGVTEKTFLRRVAEEAPEFLTMNGSFTGFETMAEFVRGNFSNLIQDRPALSDHSITIYRRAQWASRVPVELEPATGWGGFDRDVFIALQTLAANGAHSSTTNPNEKGFMYFTTHEGLKVCMRKGILDNVDFEADIVPLLPGAMDTVGGPFAAYGAPSWANLLQHSNVLEVNTKTVVKENPDGKIVFFFVDGTQGMDRRTAEALCQKHGFEQSHATSGPGSVSVVRARSDAEHTSHDEVVSPWLEAEHVIGSKVAELLQQQEEEPSPTSSSETPSAHRVTTSLVIVCAAAKGDIYAASLHDAQLEELTDEGKASSGLNVALVTDGGVRWFGAVASS